MKKKEIAAHLDRVGTLVANANALATVNGKGKRAEIDGKQMRAALMGISVGIALGAGICDGEYEPDTPIEDAGHVISATIDLLARDSDE